MVVQFTFLSMEMDVKSVNVTVKNKSTTWHQNVQNFAVKPLACGLWFHMSLGFDAISMVNESTDHGNFFVDLFNIYTVPNPAGLKAPHSNDDK